jgi:hypothetical protein
MYGWKRSVLLEEPAAGNLHGGVCERKISQRYDGGPKRHEAGNGRRGRGKPTAYRVSSVRRGDVSPTTGFGPTNPITFRFAPASTSVTQVFWTKIEIRAKQFPITDLYLLKPPPHRSSMSCTQDFILSQNSKFSRNALQFPQAQIAGTTSRVVQ